MRQLLLMRHAKSSWDDATLADHLRPLNARGRKAAVAMRGRIHKLGLEPDLILVSSATRTMQTLDALEPWDDQPLIEPMENLYLAPAPLLLTVLNGIPETVRSAMMIGHNPGLHDLALMLASETGEAPARRRLKDGFPTGALLEFSVALPWARLGPGGGQLVRFVAPKDLMD
jgi:phosphohistidine phosphatase